MTRPQKKRDSQNEQFSRAELQKHRLLDITMLLPSLKGTGWRATLRERINTSLCVPELNRLFQEAEHQQNPFNSILEKLDITPDSGGLTDAIPKSGACIVVANHPNGGSDALTLAGKCVERRSDTKALANSVLTELPGLEKWMIPLNIMGQKDAKHRNQVALKRALAHLRDGGLLLVFPAGTISHWQADQGRVADPEWSVHIARLAKKAGVPVLPVRIFEKNPAWFDMLGAVHLNVRSALVPRLLISSSGNRLVCRAGRVIEPSKLAACVNAKEATGVIRRAVQVIKHPSNC